MGLLGKIKTGGVVMSKHKCAHAGRIERREQNGTMHCCREKRTVRVIVDKEGNYCADTKCKFASKPAVLVATQGK